MKKIIVLGILMLSVSVNAQEIAFMYDADGTKVYFQVSNVVRYLQFEKSAKNSILDIYKEAQEVDTIMPDILKFTLKESDVVKFENKVRSEGSIFLAKELIYTNDGTIQCCFNKIILQPKDNVDLRSLLEEYQIPYKSFKSFGLADNEYLIELSVSEALHYANLLYETKMFTYAVPLFYRTNILNNPLYSSQWGLKNTGQNCSMHGIDIMVEPAWKLSTGKDIVVAVVDNGVQLDHPDLAANILPGYDALELNNNGGCSNSDSHGTCCAGIISAVDNTIGIKGIACEAKIVPIRVGQGDYFSDEAIINSFLYIYQNDIDIVSCSWGGGSNIPTLTNAINIVVTNGRNGLGCPILFAAGNDDTAHISYPASLANTISVGAMSPCGERKAANSCDGETNWGSNYGSRLDVVAPGVFIPTTTTNSGYIMDFNGTSAACPHAAGVMALILSVNPCLTATEAKEILCSTCDKLSGYSYDCDEEFGSWNMEVGYGKINAYKAISKAMNIYPENYIFSSEASTLSSDFWWVISFGCDLAAGQYRVKRYELVKNISFPYKENPAIYAVSNGYSAANPNNEQYYCSVSNLTNNSATVKTWVYNILYNINGQQINTYIPVNPNHVQFSVSVFDVPDTNININNVSIVDMNYNRNALQKIETADFSVQGSSDVQLRAGEEILLGDGTLIQPNASGEFYAYIQPFQSCVLPESSPSELLRSEEIYMGNNFNKDSSSTSVSEPESGRALKTWPNPVSGMLHIQLPDAEKGIARITVCDLLGKVVLQKENLSQPELEVSSLAAGMYLLKLQIAAGKAYTGKFVKD